MHFNKKNYVNFRLEYAIVYVVNGHDLIIKNNHPHSSHWPPHSPIPGPGAGLTQNCSNSVSRTQSLSLRILVSKVRDRNYLHASTSNFIL